MWMSSNLSEQAAKIGLGGYLKKKKIEDTKLGGAGQKRLDVKRVGRAEINVTTMHYIKFSKK